MFEVNSVKSLYLQNFPQAHVFLDANPQFVFSNIIFNFNSNIKLLQIQKKCSTYFCLCAISFCITKFGFGDFPFCLVTLLLCFFYTGQTKNHLNSLVFNLLFGK